MKTSGAKRIAERYVKALFEVAKSASALGPVEADMRSLEQLLRENDDFRGFLTNPLLPRDTQADAMAAILAKMQAHEVTRQFMAMLTHQKRLPLLGDIAALFAQWAQAARGEMSAQIVSASPLGAADIAQVSQRLSKAFGKTVHLETRHDPALLGGVVINIGSQQMDASLAGKMARLGQILRAA